MDGCQHIQETVVLLRILALGNRQIEAGRVRPAADVVAQLRDRRRGQRGVIDCAHG